MGAHVVHARGVGRDDDANGRVGQEQVRSERWRDLGRTGQTAGFVRRGAVRTRGVGQRGTGEVEEPEHAFEVGVGQVGAFQRTAHEVHNHGVLQVRAPQVCTRQVGIYEDGFAQVHACQIGIGQVAA